MAQSHYSLGRNTLQLSPLPLQSETHRRSQSPSLLDVLVNHTQSRTFCNRKKKSEHITLLPTLRDGKKTYQRSSHLLSLKLFTLLPLLFFPKCSNHVATPRHFSRC